VTPVRLTLASTALLVALVPRGAAMSARPIETTLLNAVGGLPAHLVAGLYEPIGFVETAKGEFILLDRRAHMVYAVNAAKTKVREVLKVGFEQGRVLEPGILSLGSDDVFAVSDAPGGLERIQYFNTDGLWIGGFYLDQRTKIAPRLVIDSVVVNGAGSLQFSDHGFLINQPESDALITELDLNGYVVRRFGALRATGHENDRDLHLAHNVGQPLAAGDGGVYFVFRTGVPLIRKYDASGTLVFERHVEGPELDPAIQSLPNVWPRRPADEGHLPIVPPLVRTAAVDRDGRLWVSLIEPFTYVYDRRGTKVRTVQFKGASVLSPASLFFTSHGTVLVTPGCYEFAVPSPNTVSQAYVARTEVGSAWKWRTTIRSALRSIR
jgi:hypothetical protein